MPKIMSTSCTFTVKIVKAGLLMLVASLNRNNSSVSLGLWTMPAYLLYTDQEFWLFRLQYVRGKGNVI